MSWGWRVKPRSVIKTVQWFKYFSKLENRKWTEKTGQLDNRKKSIFPIRREYVYNARKDEDEKLSNISYEEYITGKFDVSETESNARNDKATYEFFGLGYVNKDGIIKCTEVGNLIENDKLDSEYFLKQLLKMHFPNKASDIGRNIPKGKVVFPLQIILKILERFKYVNKYELGFVFACNSLEEIETLYKSIEEFRKRYNELPNKMDKVKCQNIFEDIYKRNYKKKPNIKTLCRDYADALNRSLLYTGLFKISGRGNYTKLRIAEHSKKKVEMLIQKYNFIKIDAEDIEEYMEWYGSAQNVILPWENKSERKELIYEKINLLRAKIEEYKKKYEIEIDEDINKYIKRLKISNKNNELKSLEKELVERITNLNEQIFIKYISKNEETRKNILNKFEDIVKGNEDMAALWLECNTWRSLVVMDGEKEVKRNFSIEEDLSPRYFAKGKGNTPDMELYNENYVIVPEVSLMTGVSQWEHEGSSVIDHVTNIIRKNESVGVIGLFISSRIYERTMWQFFILNRESWRGQPVPVIPITIKQYIDILKHIYSNKLGINQFNELLNNIHKEALKCENYEIWEKSIKKYIENWRNENRRNTNE